MPHWGGMEGAPWLSAGTKLSCAEPPAWAVPGPCSSHSFPPCRGLPDSKGNLLRFIQEVHGHYLHQRPLHMPVVVHCR